MGGGNGALKIGGSRLRVTNVLRAGLSITGLESAAFITARTAAQKWIWRMTMAHDFLGNELSIGDDVVFLNYNGTSASLERGKITKVSEHTAEIRGKKRRAEYKIIKVNPVKPTMDSTWIPCSERLPELQDTRWVRTVIVCARGHVMPMIYERDIVQGKAVGVWKWMWRGIFKEPEAITHWMPLPEPPKEGGMTDVRTR